MTPDDAALDALAEALAPRVLEKVRALLAAEQGDDRALGLAALESIGYTVGQCPNSSLFRTDLDTDSGSGTAQGTRLGSGSRSRTKRKRSAGR